MMVLGCPSHPGHKLLAYQQTSFTTTCTISIDDGEAEIEMDDRAEFVRDMETTTIVAYLCSVDGCVWSVTPEQVGRFARENQGGPALTNTDDHGTLQGVGEPQAVNWPTEPVKEPHVCDETCRYGCIHRDPSLGENKEGYEPFDDADSIDVEEVPCPDCHGTGKQSDYDLGMKSLAHSDEMAAKRHRCLACNGTGRKQDPATGREPEPEIVWQRELEQEDGESDAEFNRRKSKTTSEAVAAKKALAEAAGRVENPVDRFKRVFGDP